MDLPLTHISRLSNPSENEQRILQYLEHLRRFVVGPKGLIYAKGARATQSAGQAIVTATDTPLAFDEEDTISGNFDTDGVHSISSNTSRFVIPITGKWLCVGSVVLPDSGTATFMQIWVALDGTLTSPYGQTRVIPHTTENNSFQAISMLQLTAGQYVEFCVRHDHGSDLTTVTSSTNKNTFGSVAFMGE